MSTSGRLSNKGYTYQGYVALDWLVEMVHQDRDDPIDVVSVESVGLSDAEQMPKVDDIVIRFESGETLYIQAKKNQTDRKAWSLTELQEELRNARDQLEEDEDGRVRFYSRDQFGDVQKLAEHLREHYSNYDIFAEKAPNTLSDPLNKLANRLDRQEERVFELIQRVKFEVTRDLGNKKRDQVRRLRMVVSDPEAAWNTLWSFLAKHTSGQTGTPHHEIERDHIVQALEDADIQLTLDSNGDVPSRIITHDEKISQLQEKSEEDDTEAFLHGTNLEFVWPREGADHHPDRILERLGAPDQGGVLLVGPGGVGKSRTLLETAKRAHEHQGEWEVFHARNTDALENEQVYGIIRGKDSTSKTLLVVDEVRGVGLNYNDIYQSIKDDLKQELVILASARPTDCENLDSGDLKLFEGGIVEMRPENVSREVSSRIREEVAPTAMQDLRDDVVARLCGDRPAIALRIAQELEQRSIKKHRAGKGGLSQEDVAGIQPGDLTEWLAKRFEEDELDLQPEESEVGRPVVGTKLLTAAAVLAAAPAERDQLIEVAADVLSDRSEDPYGDGKYMVVENLKESGWLEQRELEWEGSSPNALGLSVPHDIVTDKLLDKVFEEYTGSPEKYLEQLLSPCADDLIVWSNVTESFGRLLDILENGNRGPGFVSRLSNKADEWLTENASNLAETSFRSPQTMLRGEKYRTSHALSTALDAGLWSDEVLVRELALPWLKLYGSRYRYAHILLVKVLNTGYERKTVMDVALNWYADYDYVSGASYVFRTAASQLNGEGKQSERAVELGVRWLKRYGKTSWEGQYILTALLEWNKKHKVDALVDSSLQWLNQFGYKRRAHYVLYTLLKQVELKNVELEEDKDVLAETESYAIDWLTEYGSRIEANQVINALLDNDDITDKTQREAARFASSWLSDHVPVQESAKLSDHDYPVEARFVFQPVLLALKGEDEGVSLLRKVDPVTKALLWLDQHLDVDGAEYVLAPLLDVTGPDDEGSFEEALDYSSQWLDDYGSEERAQRVYTSILRHPDVEDDAKFETAKSALQWLRAHPSAEKRDFVINSLLLNWDFLPTDEERNDVVEAAFDVASEVIEDKKEATFSSEEAKEVLVNVIDTESDYLDDAKCLLRELGYDPHRVNFERLSTTISNKIDQLEAESTERVQLLEKGADLLCDPRTYKRHCKGWHHLMGDILECDDLKNSDRERIIRALREEVCSRHASRDTRWTFGYQILFKSMSNPTKDDELIKTGFDWLQANFQHKSWPNTYKFMIDHCAMEPELRNRLIGIGKTWLNEDGKEQGDHWGDVYDWILNIKGLSEDKKKDIIRKATDFIENRRKHDHWKQVFEKTDNEIDNLESGRDEYKKMLNNSALSTN